MRPEQSIFDASLHEDFDFPTYISSVFIIIIIIVCKKMLCINIHYIFTEIYLKKKLNLF